MVKFEIMPRNKNVLYRINLNVESIKNYLPDAGISSTFIANLYK
jgi:hypothetical protein